MPDLSIKLVLFAALFLHGLGHIGALGALIWIKFSPGATTGAWLPARSWMSPSLSGSTAAGVASLFWAISLIGFVTVALSFWGVVVPTSLWRPLAVVSAIVSTLGIVMFFGTWPIFNTAAALGMNVVAVLLALLWTT